MGKGVELRGYWAVASDGDIYGKGWKGAEKRCVIKDKGVGFAGQLRKNEPAQPCVIRALIVLVLILLVTLKRDYGRFICFAYTD